MYEQNQPVPDMASAINLLEAQRLQLNQLNGVIDDLRASLDNSRASESRALEIKESYKVRQAKVTEFIQASIDNEEWTHDELSEPFWEELAILADLDLHLTRDVEIVITVTYSGTVTLPSGTDLDDIEFSNLPITPRLSARGETLDHWVTSDGFEVSE